MAAAAVLFGVNSRTLCHQAGGALILRQAPGCRIVKVSNTADSAKSRNFMMDSLYSVPPSGTLVRLYARQETTDTADLPYRVGRRFRRQGYPDQCFCPVWDGHSSVAADVDLNR